MRIQGESESNWSVDPEEDDQRGVKKKRLRTGTEAGIQDV
jgi:hypothetical protein